MAGLLYVRTGNAGTDPAVAIDDLGITIPTGAGWTLLSESGPGDPEANSGQFTARELRDSEDLYTAITGGSLEWSKDGAAVEGAASYIADYQLMQDLSDDDLDLTNGRFTLPNDTTVPGSGREGELFWDNDNESLYVHDGSVWKDFAEVVASGIDHGDLDGLDGDDHDQYLLLTGNAARNPVTGKVDFSGGELTLPQAADVPGTFTSGGEGDIAWDTDDETLYAHDGTQWFAIAPASGIITDHGGLTGKDDDDHLQYGLLAGNAARNPVTGEYDFTDGDLILPSDGTLKGSPVEGNVEVKGGVVYAYDDVRDKWLSIDRKLVSAGRRGNATNVYMRLTDLVASSQTGYRVLRDGTITGVFAQTAGTESWTFEVRRNNNATPIVSLVITAATGDEAITTNVDVDQGDELQFFVNGTQIRSPVGGVELAWRTT